MTTHPRDVVAVPDQTLVMDEAALKQVAVLFNRIACPALSALRSLPDTHNQLAQPVIRLAETGIVFEPDMQKSDDQDLKSRFLQDIDKIGKPFGVSAEDLLASRKDEKKAIEVKEKTRAISNESMSAADPLVIFGAIQRLTVNMTRFGAIQLRNFSNLDAHAIVSSQFNALEQDDESSNQHDVVRILVTALPLPDRDVSWEQIFEYRDDTNSLNRFIDLRNWITDTARGKFTAVEAEERLGPVLKRFHKQMEIHRMNTVTTTLEAFVVTSEDALRNLFSYGKNAPPAEVLCSIHHRKLVLLEGESPSEGTEVAYVLKTEFPFDT